jgi:hypothetical protein
MVLHLSRMKTEALHIGMSVRHPQYGIGTVKKIFEQAAEVQFNDGVRTLSPEASDLQAAEPQAELHAMTVPLKQLVTEAVQGTISALGLEQPDTVVEQLGARWHRGTMVLRPADPSLQAKEVPLETFFHKIVMMRNNLRVLEQKINGHEQLSDAEKVEMQQYITRCYGSMTTFNIFFKREEDQFRSKA